MGMKGKERQQMKNELFTIGPFTVYGYGLMIAVGVFSAWLVTDYRAKKQRMDRDHVFSLIIWCLLGGIVSSKLLFWITEWKTILNDTFDCFRYGGQWYLVRRNGKVRCK